MNVKEPVKLRKRKLKNGNLSLYLDIYFNGVRKYEFLKLYLSPNKADREKNKQTLQLANSIKAKRIVEIQRGSFGYSTYLINTNFLDYFRKMTEDRIDSMLLCFNKIKEFLFTIIPNITLNPTFCTFYIDSKNICYIFVPVTKTCCVQIYKTVTKQR